MALLKLLGKPLHLGVGLFELLVQFIHFFVVIGPYFFDSCLCGSLFFGSDLVDAEPKLVLPLSYGLLLVCLPLSLDCIFRIQFFGEQLVVLGVVFLDVGCELFGMGLFEGLNCLVVALKVVDL